MEDFSPQGNLTSQQDQEENEGKFSNRFDIRKSTIDEQENKDAVFDNSVDISNIMHNESINQSFITQNRNIIMQQYNESNTLDLSQIDQSKDNQQETNNDDNFENKIGQLLS